MKKLQISNNLIFLKELEDFNVSVQDAINANQYLLKNLNNIKELEDNYNHLVTNYTNSKEGKYMLFLLSKILRK